MDFFTQYHEYHLKIIDTLKTALYQKDSAIFDKLDFYDDAVFSEPFLFSSISDNNELWIDSLIFGLSKNRDLLKDISIPVIDENIIYLPTIGSLELSSKQKGRVILNYKNNSIKVEKDDNEIDFILKPIIKNSCNIEFISCSHPLFISYFKNDRGENTSVLIDEELYKKHISNFNKALSVIEKIYPEYFDLIKKYISKVVFYVGDANSFATIQAHGMIFLNVKDEYDEVFFIEDIVHQTAHVFFNTLTFIKSDLFLIPYNSCMDNDVVSVYDRFHGLFTHVCINIILEECIKQKLFSGRKYYELVARFTINMNRFAVGIQKFDKPNLFKLEGERWFSFFKCNFQDTLEGNKKLLSKYNVSNQPYVFSYVIFKKTNEL